MKTATGSDAWTQGGCLCGGVRFELDRARVKWCANCHCSRCRRAHGAGFVAWVSVPDEALRITAGEALVERYAASPDVVRGFCRRCGTSFLFKADRWAGETHLTLANLDAPGDLRPRVHAFFSDRAQWVEVHDELPRRGGPSGTEPL